MKIGTAVLIILMCSCTSVQGKNESSQKNENVVFTRLFPVSTWQDASGGLAHKPSDDVKELLAAECGIVDFPTIASESEEVAPIVASIISIVAGTVIKQGVAALDTKLQNQLKEYSAEYSAVYKGDWPSSKCWRIVRAIRIKKADEGISEKILFDALFVMDSNTNVTRILPLRLAMLEPATKEQSKSKKYGVALSVSIKSTTRNGFENVGEVLVMKRDLSLTDKQKINYLDPELKPKGCEVTVSEPYRYCVKSHNEKFITAINSGNKIELTATVSEVGEPPKFLKMFAKVFSGASEDIGKALADLAAAKINPDEKE